MHAGAEDPPSAAGGGDLLWPKRHSHAVPEGLPAVEEPAFRRWTCRKKPPRATDATRSRHQPAVVSTELGPPPTPILRAQHLWMLERACRFGAARVQFICLWNGTGADGPGGTRHMFEQVQQAGGKVHWLDTRRLWST